MNKNEWKDYFRETYSPYLDRLKKKKPGLIDNVQNRASAFELIFSELLELKDKNFKIVETGTSRSGKWSDGASSLLFTDFVENFGGSVKSVDTKKKKLEKAIELVNASDKFITVCDDSVNYLKSMSGRDEVDLYYLDSYNLNYRDDKESASHHLEEFKAIEPFLSNCLVAIDDNSTFKDTGQRTGKGRMIYEYLQDKGKLPIYDDYIIVYKF